MSSEIVKGSVAELPLWQRYAEQFPVRRNLTYLNHAAVAPLPQPCADALKHLADDCLHYGSLHYDQWSPSTRVSASPPPASSTPSPARSLSLKIPPKASPPSP